MGPGAFGHPVFGVFRYPDEINEERARRKEEKEIEDARALLSSCEKS